MFLNLIIALNIAYITACFVLHLYFVQSNFFLNYHALIKHTAMLYYNNDVPIYMNPGFDVVIYAATAWLFSFCVGLKLLHHRHHSICRNFNTTSFIPQVDSAHNRQINIAISANTTMKDIDFSQIFSSWHESIIVLSSRDNIIDVVQSCQAANRQYKLNLPTLVELDLQEQNIYIGENNWGEHVLELMAQLNRSNKEIRLLILLEEIKCLATVYELDSTCALIYNEKIAAYLLAIENPNLRYIKQRVVIVEMSTSKILYPVFKNKKGCEVCKYAGLVVHHQSRLIN